MQDRGFIFLTLFMAGASAVSAQTSVPYSIRSIAGALQSGDGGPAVQGFIPGPGPLTVDANGVVYVGETLPGIIRRVGLDGILSSVAGGAVPQTNLLVPEQSSGDGGPAVGAGIREVLGVAVDTSNNLYISDVLGCRVRRVNLTTGIISAYAGDGVCRSGPDGPVATTSFQIPRSLSIDAQGRLLVVDANRLRRIDVSAGTVTTIAGNGTSGLAGNGGPAAQALIDTPGALALDSAGNIYFTEGPNCLVRQIAISSGTLQTIAGTTCGYAGDNGQASAAKLDNPSALLVDAGRRRLYVAEAGAGSRIRAINLDTGAITTYAGTGPAGFAGDGGPANSAQLAQPSGLAFDQTGALLVSESSNRVRRIDLTGIVTTFAGGPTTGGDGGQASAATFFFNGTGPIASNHKGGYVFSDQGNGRIRAVSASGVIQTIAGTDQFAGGTGDGGPAIKAGVGTVFALAVDSAGNVYFADAQGNLRRITTDGIVNKFVPTTFITPYGIGVDLTRNVLYVCEGHGNRLDRVDLATGSTTVFAGSGTPGAPTAGYGFAGDNGPASQALLFNPISVSVDAQGNVYVFDQSNVRIRKITPSGSNIVTIAGNGMTLPGGISYSSGDGGPATSATIFTFSGVASDAVGNVFIGEGNRIRRVDVNTGIINTIAGTGAFGFTGDGGPAASARISVSNFDIDPNGNFLLSDSNRVRLVSDPNAVSIITVDTLGGFPDIAQNAWVEINGLNLAPASLANGLTWSNAPDFASGKMPTSLGNVSVTVNGKPAFLYYVSPLQVNVLTPLDNTVGPVQMVVTNAGKASAPVTVNLRQAAPSPFKVGATNYFLATHVDGSLVGPSALSVPGYAFTPVKGGETIVLYVAGLGLPSTPLMNGSAMQAGTLPSLPVVQIGGNQATVSFAGVIAPGLYQLNVVVPVNAVSGDNSISVSYGGAATPAGTLITVQ
jgi:uncharacterized protein (TIGR03437 family)